MTRPLASLIGWLDRIDRQTGLDKLARSNRSREEQMKEWSERSRKPWVGASYWGVCLAATVAMFVRGVWWLALAILATWVPLMVAWVTVRRRD